MLRFAGSPENCYCFFGASRNFVMNYSAVTRTNIASVGRLLVATMMLAGCGSTIDPNFGPPGRTAEPAAITPHEQAARDCWAETEHGAKSLPLDKRAKAVDKCVKDKMNAARTTSTDTE
jgi:hypothetical protein